MERDIFTEALHKSQSSAPNIASQVGFDETAEVLEKGRRASIGEIRDWKGQKMQKTTDGWKPVKAQRKAPSDLEEVDSPSVKSGNVTVEELDNMPVGTEIHFDNNGSYFRRAESGWIFGNSITSNEYRLSASGIEDVIHTRQKSNGWDVKKVLMPKKNASISDIKVGDSITIQGFGPCSVIKTGSEGLSLKRDADGVEFTLSKEWVEKLGLKSAKGGEGKSTDGLTNVKNLAKDFLTTADKLETNVSRYLNGSNDKEDVDAYNKVMSLEKKFLEAYNKHFDERIAPALNYDIAESVLDEE